MQSRKPKSASSYRQVASDQALQLSLRSTGPQVRRPAEWATLVFCPPYGEEKIIGIILHLLDDQRLHVRVLPDWTQDLAADAAEIWDEIDSDLEEMSVNMGSRETFDYLEQTASHVFRLSDRQAVSICDEWQELNDLYTRFVVEKSQKVNRIAATRQRSVLGKRLLSAPVKWIDIQWSRSFFFRSIAASLITVVLISQRRSPSTKPAGITNILPASVFVQSFLEAPFLRPPTLQIELADSVDCKLDPKQERVRVVRRRQFNGKHLSVIARPERQPILDPPPKFDVQDATSELAWLAVNLPAPELRPKRHGRVLLAILRAPLKLMKATFRD